MAEDILLTCQAISFKNGYPVLQGVFKHMARTPEKYVVWMEPAQLGVVHLFLQYSNGRNETLGDINLVGAGQDFAIVSAPPAFEGGVEVVMIDAQTGNARCTRHAHFGGAT